MYGKHNLMIGEFGYDERRVPGKGYKHLTPEMDQYQLDMIKGQLDRLLDLRLTYIFLWQMYCNEKPADGRCRSHRRQRPQFR